MYIPDANIPAPPTTYISPNPKLSEQKDIAMNYLKQIMHEHGLENINMELKGSTAESGISKAISGSSVQKIINKNQMLYSRVEKEVFDILKRWTEVLALPNMRLQTDDELRVIYPKPKVMISDTETLNNIKMKLELGLIEKWEAFIALDPNLSEEEAKEKLERINIEKMNSAMRALSNVGVQSEPGFEDSQAEPQ